MNVSTRTGMALVVTVILALSAHAKGDFGRANGAEYERYYYDEAPYAAYGWSYDWYDDWRGQQPRAGLRDADAVAVSGQVLTSRTVLHNADDSPHHRIVLLKTSRGRRIAVDLGAGAVVNVLELRPGTQLHVVGFVVAIKGAPVLLASKFRLGGVERETERAD